MELFILKSTICLSILLLFYRFFLEKESFHVFKRYFLLFSVVISHIIPLISVFSTTKNLMISEIVFAENTFGDFNPIVSH